MKRNYLQVCCIIMFLAFLFLPMTCMNDVGGTHLKLEYYIRNVHIYGGSKLGYLISLFGYLLILIAAFFKKGAPVIKCLSLTALVSPIMVLVNIVGKNLNHTGAWIYCLLSVVFFILCLTLKSDRQPDKKPVESAEYNRNEDIARHKGISVCAYLGILVLIPLFGGRDSRFARFHANQGLALLIGLVAVYVLKWILWKSMWVWLAGNPFEPGVPWRWIVFNWFFILVTLFFVVLAVIGITNVLRGEEKRLPLIGKIRLLK